MEPNNLDTNLNPVSQPTDSVPNPIINEEPRHPDMKPALLVIVTIIIIALAIFGYSRKQSPQKSFSSETQSIAEPGSLVEGVSQALIIVKDASITTSKHSIIEDKNGFRDLFTAQYTTRSSLNSLFVAYLDYMKENGYTILSSTAEDNTGRIFGRRTVASLSETLVITVSNTDNARSVDISVNKSK